MSSSDQPDVEPGTTPDERGSAGGNADESVDAPRQRVIRVPGARRAKLTPAPGAGEDPTRTDGDEASAPTADAGAPGPNDDQLRRDVPPHY